MIKDREKKTTSNRFHRLCCCLSFRITGRCALPLLVTGVGSWRGGGGGARLPSVVRSASLVSRLFVAFCFVLSFKSVPNGYQYITLRISSFYPFSSIGGLSTNVFETRAAAKN